MTGSILMGKTSASALACPDERALGAPDRVFPFRCRRGDRSRPRAARAWRGHRGAPRAEADHASVRPVQEKLHTLADIYRFAVEQTSMARGELLELTVVLILVIELVLLVAGAVRF
jgi:hypothetical protein